MSVLQMQKAESYLRDRFLPFEQANLSIASSPVLYGLSIYTVFSANWNEAEGKLYIFRLEDHYRRLVNSARIMDFSGFEEQWPWRKFRETMMELLRRNDPRESVLVRVTVFVDELAAGTKIHGLSNALSAYIYPMGEILPLAGAHLCVSSWTRTSDNSMPARAKVNGSYINASLMKNEALRNGYDDAVALDAHGHVTESSVANIFMLRNGKLITPAEASDLLEGITRDSVLKIADELGIKTEQRSIDRSELYIADEIFLCGSSARITPVLSVDKRPVGDGRIGRITSRLSKNYEMLQTSQVDEHAGWRLEV